MSQPIQGFPIPPAPQPQPQNKLLLQRNSYLSTLSNKTHRASLPRPSKKTLAQQLHSSQNLQETTKSTILPQLHSLDRSSFISNPSITNRKACLSFDSFDSLQDIVTTKQFLLQRHNQATYFKLQPASNPNNRTFHSKGRNSRRQTTIYKNSEDPTIHKQRLQTIGDNTQHDYAMQRRLRLKNERRGANPVVRFLDRYFERKAKWSIHHDRFPIRVEADSSDLETSRKESSLQRIAIPVSNYLSRLK